MIFLSALEACKVYYCRAGWSSLLSSLIWLLESAFDLMTNIYFYSIGFSSIVSWMIVSLSSTLFFHGAFPHNETFLRWPLYLICWELPFPSFSVTQDG